MLEKSRARRRPAGRDRPPRRRRCAAAWASASSCVGVLMGATTGIVGATVVTLGLLTLPTLLRRGYDKGLACGAICASGTLGQIIPPSLILILLADILQLSVGTLFAAAVIPGLMLAGDLLSSTSSILGIVRPRHGAGRAAGGARPASRERELAGKLLARWWLPPVALVGAVLGSIIGGIAAPTEAASMGALGAIVVTAIGGRHVVGGAARDRPRDHQDHRDDDVHPDLRAGLRARVPRPAGRGAGRRTCSSSCRAASMPTSGS